MRINYKYIFIDSTIGANMQDVRDQLNGRIKINEEHFDSYLVEFTRQQLSQFDNENLFHAILKQKTEFGFPQN